MQKNNKQTRDRILLVALRTVTYILIEIVFFLCLWLGNPYLLAINRTFATTFVTLTAALFVFSHAYGGFRVGELKRSSVIINMYITVLLSDGFAYLILEIMNVNARNKRRLDITDDIGFFFLALAVQFVLIALAVFIGDRLYRKIHPARKCCVITDSEESFRLIARKLPRLSAWFTVAEHALTDDPGIHDMIRRNECCILFHLPLEQHFALTEYCYKYEKPVYFDMRLANIVVRDSETLFVDDVLMGVHTHHALSLRQRFIKRVMDIVLSLVMIIVSSPIMLTCAIAIRLDDGGPCLFRQERLTRNNRVFRIYKFRTMRNDPAPRDVSVMTDDDRITRVGHFLRRYRLDELPQLFNILKGEMSLVGPRPEMLANIEKYTQEIPEFAYRGKVKAGLTGYAQINGKYNTPPREKLMMDLSYIDNYSLWMDIKLLLKTVLAVMSPESTEAFDTVKEDKSCPS